MAVTANPSRMAVSPSKKEINWFCSVKYSSVKYSSVKSSEMK